MEINQPSAPAGAGRGAIAEGGQRLHSGILHRFLGHLETLAGHGQNKKHSSGFFNLMKYCLVDSVFTTVGYFIIPENPEQ